MVNIAIFVSGTGSNCENLIQYFKDSDKINIALVISNKSDALALKKAEALGVSTAYLNKDQIFIKENILSLLSQFNIDFIILAGFLLVIPDFLIEAYPDRIINLHPSLLPKFGGKGMYGHHVHDAVIASGEKESGITIHYVNNKVDGGKIIAQFKCQVSDNDDSKSLAEKIHELEMKNFPPVVEKLIDDIF